MLETLWETPKYPKLQNIQCVVSLISQCWERKGHNLCCFFGFSKTVTWFVHWNNPGFFPSEKHDANHLINLQSPGWCFSNLPWMRRSLKHLCFLLNTTYSFSGSQGSWTPTGRNTPWTGHTPFTHTLLLHTQARRQQAHAAYKHLKRLALRQRCSFYRVRLHPSWAGTMLSSRRTAYLNKTMQI